MAEIRACDEEIKDDAIACPCTLGIVKRIEERDEALDKLRQCARDAMDLYPEVHVCFTPEDLGDLPDGKGV